MLTWSADAAKTVQSELGELALAEPGCWAFAVREGGTGIASVNGEVVMSAASTSKVALLLLALQDVQSARRSLDDAMAVPEQRVGGSGVLNALPSVQQISLAEVLELMIVVSDNVATNMIIDALGAASLDSRIEALGARHTRLQRRLMDPAAIGQGHQNVTTADDQALLLDRLCGDLLSPSLRGHALEVLGRQQFNDRLPVRLDADVTCRHKTGEINGIRHDVGILEFDDRQLVLAALGSELSEPADRTASSVIGQAAQIVVGHARTAAA